MKIFFKGIAPLVTYYYTGQYTHIVLDEGKYLNMAYTIIDVGSHPNAYIGMGTKHRLAGRHYDHIELAVHGGLTYSEYGTGFFLRKGYYWIGWDYAHLGDCAAFAKMDRYSKNDKKWTFKEIFTHVLQAIEDFKKL